MECKKPASSLSPRSVSAQRAFVPHLEVGWCQRGAGRYKRGPSPVSASVLLQLLFSVTLLTLGLSAGGALSERDFADPFVLRAGETYFAYATNRDDSNVQVARSRDLSSWELLPDALPRLPTWAAARQGLTWAPSVLQRGDRFVLYYTARHVASGFQCISRAVADRPEGPFRDESPAPFVCQVEGETRFCGSIDPSPFVDPKGAVYLLWKSDENATACRGTSRIWAQAMTGDGLELTGDAKELTALDAPWEGPLLEGPSMIAAGGRYFLFYSANWWESDRYAIGYATCETALGPCRKQTGKEPFAKTAGKLFGPGGQEFFTDALGQTWMAFHAWTSAKTSYALGGVRALHFAMVEFADATPKLTRGWPRVEQPKKTGAHAERAEQPKALTR